MSTVPEPIIEDWVLQEKPTNKLNAHLPANKNKPKHSLKYKENHFKHKCNKALKNKLKKYKLRRDGKEDPDVTDVSHRFQSALKIKSSINNNNEELSVYDSERPKNYLSKMVKRKRDVENGFKTLFKELPGKNVSTDIPPVTTDTTYNEVASPSSQDKKHTNAFKLMMESRNKSIGGNSPGKEKPFNEAETQLAIEQKNNKAKRLLVLQKMAEQKGSLKKKEKEELQEEAIKRKMDKRAERLTKMLVHNGNKKVKSKKEQAKLVTEVADTELPTTASINVCEEKAMKKQINGALHLINIFDEPDNKGNNKTLQKAKSIPKEDLEFLKKLSPSIKKKENMLCYFKKIEKDSEPTSPGKTDNTENDSPVIKVKFGARNKKKIKKKKLTLNTQNSLEDNNDKCYAKDNINNSANNKCDAIDSINKSASNKCDAIDSINNSVTDKCDAEDNLNDSLVTNKTTNGKKGTRKRKREQAAEEKSTQKTEINEHSLELTENDNGRPKRNVKKPLQYQDDFLFSSSDEEYNIFTPKKKKPSNKKIDTPKYIKEPKSIIGEGTDSTKAVKEIKKKKELTRNNDANKKANVKLAPIFAPKPQLDQAALEAKQRFLQSGVPEKLKKIASQQKQADTEVNSFHTAIHVQQIDSSENIISTSPISDTLRSDSDLDLSPLKCTEKAVKIVMSPEKPSKRLQIAKPVGHIRKILQNIKQSYPKFPVYRTYQLLKEKSKGEFGVCSNFPEFDNSIEIINNVMDVNKLQVDKLNWTDKYKPMVTNEIIGNFETTKELKRWLETWSASDAKRKANDKDDSDSSDFCHSDTDSKDSMKTNDNLLILTGPTGCGKTSCVYAVAADLAIKVIEVNASSKRNGKIMLQDLQEATQSHKVNRGQTGSTENSQKSQELVEVDLTIKTKKRGRPKKNKEIAKIKQKSEPESQSTNSQESTRTGMSLILIDDADIVFDQDDGFCSAISQLVQYSKRPVILVTTSLDCAHLQRLMQGAKIMNMKALLPRMLGTWLDIMCLADSGTCWPGLGSALLDVYRGDIRKTVNCLQFYATAHTQNSTRTEEDTQNLDSLHDENSSMSWAGSEIQEESNSACEASLQLADTLWKYFMEKESHLRHIRFPSDLWNVWSNIPHFFFDAHRNGKVRDSDDKERQTRELHEIANIIDNISSADYFASLRPDTKPYICSQPWYSAECDSTSELENFSYYNKSYDVNDDISKTLLVRSICNAQSRLQLNEELYVKPTNMAVQRERDRIVSRHDTISSHLNPGVTLDRRALALDYWSSCRDICRFEKAKTDNNSKRNNRFCHYLRSLKITCKNDVFDKLCESLSAKEGDG